MSSAPFHTPGPPPPPPPPPPPSNPSTSTLTTSTAPTLALALAPDTSRKRARPTKSCLECRRKKLKCDRVQPCMQCKKLGRETQCTYASGPAGIPDTTPNSRDGRFNKRPRVEVSRLASWGGQSPENHQEIGHGYGHGGPSEIPYPLQHMDVQATTSSFEDGAISESLGRVHVKGGRSRYVGLGDRISLLDHFPDEKNFIMASWSDPLLCPMVKELAAYQKTFLRKMKRFPSSTDDRSALVAEIINSLPEDSTIDILTSRYTSNLENALRIVHKPTFFSHCVEIKSVRRSQALILPSHIPEAVLPQLLSVIVISARLSDSNDLGSPHVSDDQISMYMSLVRRWLDGLKGKNRITLDSLRAELLLLVALSVNNVSMPELWKESGNLVRVAMIMGLHRDPEDLVEISKFTKEQRRKIWQTVVELDLQCSLGAGLPPAIQAADFNSRPPIHVDDQDLTKDMIEYPLPKPEHVWTDALPQIILGLSIRERLEAANLLARNIILERDAPELVGRGKSLEKALHMLQNILPLAPKGKQSIISNIILDVFIRRFSVALLRTVALSEQAFRYSEARNGALRNSVAILSHLDALDPAVADLDTIKSKDYLNFFHIMCKNDIIQGALLLCYEIRAFNSPSRDRSTIDDSVPWTKHSLTRIVENTLNSHFQRLGEFGSDLKILLPLSIVLQSVRSDGTPEGKRELMIKGTERIFKACQAAPGVQILPKHAQQIGIQMPNTPTASEHTPENWAPQVAVMTPQFGNGGFADFNQLQGAENFGFQNFDFTFEDWDIGQAWL